VASSGEPKRRLLRYQRHRRSCAHDSGCRRLPGGLGRRRPRDRRGRPRPPRHQPRRCVAALRAPTIGGRSNRGSWPSGQQAYAASTGPARHAASVLGPPARRPAGTATSPRERTELQGGSLAKPPIPQGALHEPSGKRGHKYDGAWTERDDRAHRETSIARHRRRRHAVAPQAFSSSPIAPHRSASSTRAATRVSAPAG
jgi:hypothetical protein